MILTYYFTLSRRPPLSLPLGPLSRGKNLPHNETLTTLDFLYYYYQLVRTRLESRT